jgi:predicted component of type VI protein secretion system
MTIDERLEALTHSVELIAQAQLKTEKEIHTLGRYIRAIVLDHEARLLVLEGGEKDKD